MGHPKYEPFFLCILQTYQMLFMAPRAVSGYIGLEPTCGTKHRHTSGTIHKALHNGSLFQPCDANGAENNCHLKILILAFSLCEFSLGYSILSTTLLNGCHYKTINDEKTVSKKILKCLTVNKAVRIS